MWELFINKIKILKKIKIFVSKHHYLLIKKNFFNGARQNCNILNLKL
jgi:hypothetical protein